MELPGDLDALDARWVSSEEPADESVRLAVACHLAWLSANSQAFERRAVVGTNDVVLRAGEVVAEGLADHAEVASAVRALIDGGAVDSSASLVAGEEVMSAAAVDDALIRLLLKPPSSEFVDGHIVLVYPITSSKRAMAVQDWSELRSKSVSVVPAVVGVIGDDGVLDVTEYSDESCDS